MRYSPQKTAAISIAMIAIAFFVSIDSGAYAAIFDAPATNSTLAISLNDLAHAGFSNMQPQPQTPEGHYPLPNLYYWVDTPIDATTTTTNDLLMISMTSVPRSFSSIYEYQSSQPINVGNTSGLEGVMGNRTTIDFVKNSEYVVIIGPGKIKVEKIAAIVAGKI